MPDATDKLHLYFHGRIIDSLGIQMYQSPVAAVAELIANAWDADATEVDVELPDSLSGDSRITVHDNGLGMTFEQCQDWYLNVGRNRRVNTDRSPGRRPVLGRKGIGKFAGFGIAEILEVDTTSGETGERTVFRLDLNSLRRDDYVDTAPKEIPLLCREMPNGESRAKQGTTVTLSQLKLSRKPNENRFRESMARRFLIKQSADNFRVRISGSDLPHDNALMGVEFDFPSDYREQEKPEGLEVDNGIGIEKIGEDEIRWRIRFTKCTIGTEELRGVSVFCGIKVAQTPFFFNLSGGLSGQHGQQYISGQVQADYLDKLDADIITTERQRINWEHPESKPLEEWGRNRIKSLLSIWKDRRAEENLKRIDDRAGLFSKRLARLSSTERRTVNSAIKKIAGIESISEDQFEELSNGILTAWEGGRLHELISDVANVEYMDEAKLLSLLAEAQVLNALHVAEAVRAKVEVIAGLRDRIEGRDLENAVRNYIAENPWLLSPEWETFKKETAVKALVAQAAKDADLENDESGNKRVDLAMSSGRQLLIVEFMRPGLTVDWDHINRYQRYIDVLRASIKANTGLGFDMVSGLLVADKLDRPPGMDETLSRLAEADMKALEWRALLERAEKQWNEFLTVLVERVPDDDRLSTLRTRCNFSATDDQTSSDADLT